MTHEYTILTGGRITGSGDAALPTAIAWAAGIVLAVGGDDAVLAVSRGDSLTADLCGAVVRPLGAASLQPGDPADFEILDRTGTARIAVVRGGHVVAGSFPGLAPRAG